MSASYEGATEIVGGAGIPSDGSPFLVAQIDVCGQPVPSAPIGIAGAVAFVDLLGQVCQLTAVRDEIGIAFCTTAFSGPCSYKTSAIVSSVTKEQYS